MSNLLRSERNAWAFAVRNLKPFLKDIGVTKEDLEIFKNNSLHAYVDKVKRILKSDETDNA